MQNEHGEARKQAGSKRLSDGGSAASTSASPLKRSRAKLGRNRWTVDLHTEQDRIKAALEREVPAGTFDAEQIQAKLWIQADECSKFADVEILFADAPKLCAHRCVLTLGSGVFDRMFDIEMQEAQSCKIYEQSISRPAYREFLRYMYTGRCGPSCDEVDASDLYTLANMHDKTSLCEWVISQINGESVIAAAQFAHDSEDDFLKARCHQFAREHFSSISRRTLGGVAEEVVAGFVQQAPSHIEAFMFVHGWYRANALSDHEALTFDAEGTPAGPSCPPAPARDRSITEGGLGSACCGMVGQNSSIAECSDKSGAVLSRAAPAATAHGGQSARRSAGLSGLLQLVDLSKIPAAAIRDHVIPSGLVEDRVILPLLLSRSVELEERLGHQEYWVQVNKALGIEREFGRRGCGEGEIVNPGGIALSLQHNIVALADGGNHRVQVSEIMVGSMHACCCMHVTCMQCMQVFDLKGSFLRSLGEKGHGVGQLMRPRDVCLTPDNDICVADTGNHRVQIFYQVRPSLSLSLSPSLPLSHLPLSPSLSHTLHQDGRTCVIGAGLGSDPGQLNKPSSVAVSHEGKLVVADSGNHRIQIFDQDGSLHCVFGHAGSEEGEFKDPRAVAINSQNEILVSDTNNHRIQIFDARGRLQRCFGRLGDGNNEFRMPRKVAIGPCDDIVVADKINNRVCTYIICTHSTHTFSLTVCIGPCDDIVVADKISNRGM